MNKHRLLERFLRYVRIDTTACDDAGVYPSSPGQRDLGRLLVEELLALGIADAKQNEHGIVLATVPATAARPAPTIALCAHLDTSPETSGANIQPQIIESYLGGDIALANDSSRVIRVADNPELKSLHGRTLITSDGTTLLGADDKAGVAIIMEAAAWLVEHPEIAHGPVRICFTCDEEIGRGVDKLNVEEIAATVCYTLDGHGSNEIDVETFSADQAIVAIHGVNIHPSIAKGRMTNAVRAAAEFTARLPRDRLSPETTDGREGFLHPYEIQGGVGEVKMKILLRDFDATKLMEQAEQLKQTAAAVEREFPAAKIDVRIDRQYRNMAEGLQREPRAVAYAERALQKLGRTPKLTIVRGGTDGSRLTELGLPTPNLSCGGHNPHSPLEWACLDEMLESVQWIVTLAETWANKI
jgi:tripeptide aminopeptidase